MGEEKGKRAEEAKETAENPRKVPRLDLPITAAVAAGPGCSAAAPPELSNSTSTGYEVEVKSDITGIEECEDLCRGRFMDSEDLDMVISEITSAMRKYPRRGAKAEETAESPRKYPRQDLLNATAEGPGCSTAPPLELSSSTSTGKGMEVTSDSTDSVGCEHLFMDREDLELIVAEIMSTALPPRCEHYLCTTETGGVCKEGAGIMVCTECNSHFCSGAAARYNPQGGARWHANLSQHWVALWYDDPYTGHCFQCEHSLNLGEHIANYAEGMVADNGKDDRRMVVRHDEWGSARATGDGYVINGLLNLGNTCYMNALVQCLFALCKLRTMMLGPDAPSGTLGVRLKDFFVEMSSAARCTLSPQNLLGHIQKLFPKFTPNQMHDSHELLKSLCNTLDREAEELNRHSIIDSIFRGQLSDIIYCNRCSNASVTHTTFDDLAVPLPSKDRPARSAASPRTKNRRSPRKLRKNLFPTIDESNAVTAQAIAGVGDSQVPGSQLVDVAMEKAPRPLQVDSTEVKQIWQGKDVVHCSFQTQKNVVPGEIIKVPVMAADFIPDLFDDNCEGMGESTADSLNPGDIGPPPLASIQAKENTLTVEVTTEDKGVTTEDKGKAHSSDIVYDEAEHVKSLGSIEDCLSLLLEKHTIEWRCDNCSKVAELPSTNSIKDGEQKMASTNVSTTADGDQTEQSDRKTCQNEHSSDLNSLTVECPSSSRRPHDSDAQHQVTLSMDRITKGITLGVSYGEKYPASCSTADQIPECHEGVQEAVPSCFPADKQANLLSAQDSQDASTQNQGSEKQVKLDDHSAHQVEETQNEQKDRNGLPIQTHFISKLPPVLTIQIKRYSSGLSKLEGHVSFKEVLDVGPFLNPSSEDKDNSRYRLVGIVEHCGPNLSVGHYVAYVRGGPKPQSSGSSSWFRASDADIKEVSVEDVLRCEAYLLFYDRMEDQGIEPTN